MGMASGSGAHLSYTGDQGAVGVVDASMPFHAAYFCVPHLSGQRHLWNWKDPEREVLVFLGSPAGRVA